MSMLNKAMCLAILLVLMTTLAELRSISRWHCWSTPPHFWSLYNGPSFKAMYHNQFFFSWVGHLRSILFNFLLSNATDLPTCTRTLPIIKSEASEWISKSLSKSNNFKLVPSPKCLSRFQRPHCMLHPIHKFWMTSSKGLSKVWLSWQSFWWTCDNKKPIVVTLTLGL